MFIVFLVKMRNVKVADSILCYHKKLYLCHKNYGKENHFSGIVHNDGWGC